jgi:hypothetical protein
MAADGENRGSGDLAPMRRTRLFRTVGWLVCWLLEIPRIDDLDQAALDAHIAALAESDGRAARVPDEPGQQRFSAAG